jgi:hypothetical protein
MREINERIICSDAEQEEYELSVLANRYNYRHAIFELYHNFWRRWKYADKDITLDELRLAIYELLEDNNIHVQKLD